MNEDYVVSLSGSETPDHFGLETRGKRMRRRKQHHDGRITYSAKIYSNSDLQLYNLFQSNTKETARENKIKSKKDNKALVLKSISNKIVANFSVGLAETEKMLGGIDAGHRWKDYFGSLTYKFLTSIHCFVVNESLNTALYGEAFFASGMFGFYAVDYIQKPPKCLRICIPYVDVVAVTKAAKIDALNSSFSKPKRPSVAPLSSLSSKPSVIQIWTSAREVHQFYGFGPSFDDTFTLLVTSWQSLNPL